MNCMSYFILTVCVLIGITNGQQSNDWFAKLLNNPQPVVANNFHVQKQQLQQQQQQQMMMNQFVSPVQSTRVGAPMPTFRDTSDGMPNVVLGCWNNPCLNGATCIDNNGSNGFECKCPWGFTGDRCEKSVTICATNPCPPNKLCRGRIDGGFDCVCPADKTGFNCEIENSVCANNPCLNGGSCKEIEDGSFVCNCMKPWAGNTCNEVWKNPCTEEALRNVQVQQFKNPWDRNSFLICLDVNVHHSMRCSIGTYFNENLHHCVPEGFDPPKCPAGYCLNDGECIIDNNNLLKCICQKGFSGERCQVNIDECALEGNAACQGGMCVDQVNGYYCKCPGGTIGLNCQQTIENPCTTASIDNKVQFFELPTLNHNVYLQCSSLLEFTVRKCADNLFWNQEEETCTAERPRVRGGICLTLPCKNGGECISGGDNGFTCKCKRGFTGVTCEEMIDNCAKNPCQNGGTCVSFAGGYTCMCPNKVVDECCCHDTANPCPPRKKIIPGVNNYFRHSLLSRYIHCDFEGRAFVRSCAAGTNWNQKVLTCTPDSFYSLNKVGAEEISSPTVGGYNMRSNVLPIEKAFIPSPIVPSRSFSEYQARPVPVMNAAPVASYPIPEVPVTTTPQPQVAYPSAPVDTYQQPIIQQQAPVAPTYSNSYEQPTLKETSVPVPVVPRYEQYQQQQAPVAPTYSNSYEQPALKETSVPVVQKYEQYQQQQAPVAPTYSNSYEQPALKETSVPVVQKYEQYQQPAQPSYGEKAYKLRARFNY